MKEENPTDTPVDWILLSSVLKTERAALIERIGEAIGIHGNELLNEVEAMIDEKVAKIRDEVVKVRDELASVLTAQVAMLLNQHAQLKADTDTKMSDLRKASGIDTDGVVRLPNPLRERKAKVA